VDIIKDHISFKNLAMAILGRKLHVLKIAYLYLCQCNSITLDRPLAHTRARTRDPLHPSTSHPRSIVTHRSTKAAALEVVVPLALQGLRASDVTD
jgi:hypothetical protein